jgi:lipopolysaccharide transport system ATP-binding protein
LTVTALATTQATTEAAVEARDLRKRYQLGELGNVGRLARRMVGRGSPTRSQFEALAGVDFTVNRGEAIGIVGTNGSGKSTLLQILAGTTLPTSGELWVRGRVLPLLAVGLAFHPELTGRENITLFASSVGIPRQTIADQIDSVIDFAEVRQHADTPIKRYSSGMVSRLCVAIAVQFPADVYVFDEVLAVVDSEFQERCLTEIAQLHAVGRTVFFVSHDAEQVLSVCQRVLWLEHGAVRDFGPAARVLEEYHEAHHLAAQG